VCEWDMSVVLVVVSSSVQRVSVRDPYGWSKEEE
jgi:hypothetical protein